MKPEVQKTLQELLQKREDKNRASERHVVAEKERKTNNLTAFATVRDSIIRPALKEIVELYTTKGFPARILEKNEEINTKGGTSNPYIRLDLEPETYSYSGAMKAEFTIYFDKEKNEVWIHKSTRSSSSGGERLSLKSVTSDWIQQQFLAYANQPY